MSHRAITCNSKPFQSARRLRLVQSSKTDYNAHYSVVSMSNIILLHVP